ncbi:MAG: chemotaxis protein CheA [Saccharospirillaceae bacterium]|nr:chemotaxis protein CheA [Saccharospirillaceae bacterium]
MDMNDALQTFYAESEELLEKMDSALLLVEGGDNNDEVLNDLFRSAHTIKGSAGIFGLFHIVNFTHIIENVLDNVRDKVITIDKDLLNVLFKAKDHMGTLINTDIQVYEESEELKEISSTLHSALNKYADIKTSEIQLNEVDSEINSDSKSTNWNIHLKLSSDCLQNGMDPISFINYLMSIGTIHKIITGMSELPNIQDMDPELLYFIFDIEFESSEPKSAIEDTFMFVIENSTIDIIETNSPIKQFIDVLITDNPTVTQIDTANIKQTEEFSEKVTVSNNDNGNSTTTDSNSRTKFVRVNSERLDILINLIGELVISKQRVDSICEKTKDDVLLEAIESLGNHTESLRDAALDLRMVPIGETFQRFRRIVRDTAQELGKDIELTITGGETELDRLMVEKLTDPLIHIVRNAMDHGVESTETRIEAGKEPQGKILLSAFHDAGHVVIEVSDDGGGINKKRITEKAISLNIIDESSTLSDQELYALLFHPGFSTKEEVTNLSGRGVGMDVVNKNVQALQGSIEIESEEGVGSKFSIRLPLTLAIIDGFHVRSGSSDFIIPQATVVECMDLAIFSTVDQRRCVNLRGEMIPYIDLKEFFKLKTTEPEQVVHHKKTRKEVVIVQFGEERAGLVVDDLQGEIQTVVKPLSSIFKCLPGISGSSLLGNGEIAFILDIPQLIEKSISTENRPMETFK